MPSEAVGAAAWSSLAKASARTASASVAARAPRRSARKGEPREAGVAVIDVYVVCLLVACPDLRPRLGTHRRSCGPLAAGLVGAPPVAAASAIAPPANPAGPGDGIEFGSDGCGSGCPAASARRLRGSLVPAISPKFEFPAISPKSDKRSISVSRSPELPGAPLNHPRARLRPHRAPRAPKPSAPPARNPWRVHTLRL